jgi:hypothetical protein
MAALINARNYTVGINVNNADELEGMGVKLRAFFDEIGDGDIDIQLSVNPLLAEPSNTHAIGFAYEPAEEYYEDEIETEESE